MSWRQTFWCSISDFTFEDKGRYLVFKNSIVKGMMEAGFDSHYTNHSLWVSLATHLFDAEVDEQLIMSHTGHSSTDSMHAYRRALTKLQSDVLNNPKHKPLSECHKSRKGDIKTWVTRAHKAPVTKSKAPMQRKCNGCFIPDQWKHQHYICIDYM